MSRQVASQSISLNLVFMMATVTYSIFILSTGALHEVKHRTISWFIPLAPKLMGILIKANNNNNNNKFM